MGEGKLKHRFVWAGGGRYGVWTCSRCGKDVWSDRDAHPYGDWAKKKVSNWDWIAVNCPTQVVMNVHES